MAVIRPQHYKPDHTWRSSGDSLDRRTLCTVIQNHRWEYTTVSSEGHWSSQVLIVSLKGKLVTVVRERRGLLFHLYTLIIKLIRGFS